MEREIQYFKKLNNYRLGDSRLAAMHLTTTLIEVKWADDLVTNLVNQTQ